MTEYSLNENIKMASIKLNVSYFKKCRIEVTDGCKMVTKINGLECKENTFVPIEKWRVISFREFFFLKARNSSLVNISIIKFPRIIRDLIKKTGVHDALNIQDIIAVQNLSLIHI
jgi:hypothetical protein